MLCGLLTGSVIRFLPGHGGHSPAFGFVTGGGPPTGRELVGIALAALLGKDGLLAADGNLMGEITVRLDGPEARERVQAALAGVGFPVASVRPAA